MSETYKQLFDEAERLRGPKRDDLLLLRRLANSPDEALPMLLDILQEDADKCRGEMAIETIGLIGYPRNEAAIPVLIAFLGADINDPRYHGAVDVLFHMGPDIITPHLIRVLLGKQAPYSAYYVDDVTGWTNSGWGYLVEGICSMISWEKVDKEYALRCCPAVNYLLSQSDPALADQIYDLFSVIERVAQEADYVIPTLIELARRHKDSKIGTQAQQLISTFKPETLAPYKLLIAQFSE